MNKHKLDIQLFADGEEGSASSVSAEGTVQSVDAASVPSAGDGISSGDSATAAAEQRLRELGVPEGLARKRASRVAQRIGTPPAPQQGSMAQPPQEHSADTATATQKMPNKEERSDADAPRKPTWDEIKNDPEYNAEIQKIISSRLRTSKAAESALSKMAPAIELLARKYDLDPRNMDYDALAKAISDDDQYYEGKAAEMGTTVETAKRIDQLERDEARRKAEESRSIQDKMIRDHFTRLENQAERLKETFPSFDLRTELQNKQFARLVSPGVNLSVEDAYYAVHRQELQAAAMRVAAEKTADNISRSMASGQRRPEESGATAQAPSTSQLDRGMSKDEREALKRRIRDAAANGQRLYPDGSIR